MWETASCLNFFGPKSLGQIWLIFFPLFSYIARKKLLIRFMKGEYRMLSISKQSGKETAYLTEYIADTAAAYAKAHFAGDFETDIITVNPYMGFDTLQSFTEYCKKMGTSDLAKEKAIFVLLRTSNPGMQDIENQILQDGSHVLDRVGNHLIELQKEFAQNYGYDENQVCSPVGAVVGCTEEQDAINLRNQYPNIFFLIPGYGAQGGKAKIAGTLLGKAGGTVNSSRGVLCAWKKDEALTEKRESGILTLDDIVGAAEKVALASKTELLEMAGKYSV
jgi:orotidine-5'-phosphate decarboxylase